MQGRYHLMHLEKTKLFSSVEKQIVWGFWGKGQKEREREILPFGLVLFEELSTTNPCTQTENSLNHPFPKMEKNAKFLEIFYKCSWDPQCQATMVRMAQLKREKCNLRNKMKEEVWENLENEATCLWGFLIWPHAANMDNKALCPW